MNYEIGQIEPRFINHQEGLQFEIEDDGAVLLIFFNKPTATEIGELQYGKKFEVRFVKAYNVLTFLFKIGNLLWMDAPYSPHLSIYFHKFPTHEEGLPLVVFLIDTSNGETKYMRGMRLGMNFTNEVMKAVMEETENVFDIDIYKANINRINERYLPKDLAKLSSHYCNIN